MTQSVRCDDSSSQKFISRGVSLEKPRKNVERARIWSRDDEKGDHGERETENATRSVQDNRTWQPLSLSRTMQGCWIAHRERSTSSTMHHTAARACPTTGLLELLLQGRRMRACVRACLLACLRARSSHPSVRVGCIKLRILRYLPRWSRE